MSAFKEERLKYLYKPSNVFITALIPFWCIPKVSGASHVSPAHLQVPVVGTATQNSSAMQFQAQILHTAAMSVSVQCIASLAEAQQQLCGSACLASTSSGSGLGLPAPCTDLPYLSCTVIVLLADEAIHQEKHRLSYFCVGSKLLFTKCYTAAFHEVFNTVLYEICSVKTSTSKDRRTSATVSKSCSKMASDFADCQH